MISSGPGSEEEVWQGSSLFVPRLTWTPDGRVLFAVRTDRLDYVEIPESSDGPWKRVGARAMGTWFSPTGDLAAESRQAARGAAVLVVRDRAGDRCAEIPCPSMPGDSEIGWSPDGRRLAVATGGRLRVIDVRAGDEMCDIAADKPPEGPFGAQPFSPDGSRLVIGFPGGLEVHCPEETSRHPIAVASGLSEGFHAAWAPSTGLIATPTVDCQLTVYDIATDAGRTVEFPEGDVPNDLTWSPDCQRLAGRFDRGRRSGITVWDPMTGRADRPWIEPVTGTMSLPAWAPDGDRLAAMRVRAFGD